MHARHLGHQPKTEGKKLERTTIGCECKWISAIHFPQSSRCLLFLMPYFIIFYLSRNKCTRRSIKARKQQWPQTRPSSQCSSSSLPWPLVCRQWPRLEPPPRTRSRRELHRAAPAALAASITIQPSREPWNLTRMPSTGKCLQGVRGLASTQQPYINPMDVSRHHNCSTIVGQKLTAV